MREPSGSTVAHGSVLLLVAIIAAIGVYAIFQLQHANHDVSWLIQCAVRMLNGAVLYRDIIEVNPPLIILLIIAPIWLAEMLGLDPTTAFHVFCIIIGAASLALCNRVDSGGLFERMPRTRALFYLLLAFFYFVYSIPHFGQREHLMIMLVMPYLVLAAERRGQRHVGAKLAVTIGLFAGIGLALKPFFLILWLAIEIYLALSAGSARRVLRVENLAIVLVQFAYALIIFLFFFAYVEEVVPFVGALYGSRNREFWLVAVHALFLGLIISFPIIAFQRRRLFKSPLFPILLIAAIAFLAAFLVQQKGWAYHLVPALVTSFTLALMLLSAGIEAGIGKPAKRAQRAVLALVFVAVLTYPVAQATGLFQFYPFNFFAPLTPSYRATLSRLDALVETYANKQPIFALSAAVWPAYSLLSHGRARWPYRYPSLWPVPAFYKDPLPSAGAPKYNSIQTMSAHERDFLTAIVSDLLATPPKLVFVDAGSPKLTWRVGDPTRSNDFDYVEYLHQDPRFGRFWRQYAKIETVERFDVYRRHCDDTTCE